MGESMSIRAMAMVLGVSPSTVMRDLQRATDYSPAADGTIPVQKVMGLDGKVRLSRRTGTTGRDARILELRQSGSPVRAIADELKCSIGTVHGAVSRQVRRA